MSLWQIDNNSRLPTVNELSVLDFELPVINDVTGVTLVGGSLPGGISVDGTRLTGTVTRVITDTDFTFTLRATSPSGSEDITLIMKVKDVEITANQFITVDSPVSNGDVAIDILPIPGYVAAYITNRDLTIRNQRYTVTSVNATRTQLTLDKPIEVPSDMTVYWTTTVDSPSFLANTIPFDRVPSYQNGYVKYQDTAYKVFAVDSVVVWEILGKGPIHNPVEPYELRGAKTWKKIYLTDPEYSAAKYADLDVQTDSGGDYIIDWWYVDQCQGDDFSGWCCITETRYTEGQSYYTIGGNYYFDGETYQVPYVSDGPVPAHERTVNDEICAIERSLNGLVDTPVRIDFAGDDRLIVFLRDSPQSRNQQLVHDAVRAANDQIITEVNLLHSDIDLVTLKGDRLEDRLDPGDDLTVAVQPGSRFQVISLDDAGSEIDWITDNYLGRIQHDLLSRLAVKAESTDPNDRIVYELVSGNLPDGLELKIDGTITGRPYVFDGNSFVFTIRARNQGSTVASTRQFTLDVFNPHKVDFADLYLRPLLDLKSRQTFNEFIEYSGVFDRRLLYRPKDPNYGLQKNLDMLVYAGIERKDLEEYYWASERNHKRKRYILGDFNVAMAKESPDSETVYEVVYIEVVDPRDNGVAALSTYIQGAGTRYKTSVSNMRYRVDEIGDRERRRMPLWMRTSQNGFQEIDYVKSIPVCYCIPGVGTRILNNITQHGFQPNVINYEADRYVVKNALDYSEEQYVVFTRSGINV